MCEKCNGNGRVASNGPSELNLPDTIPCRICNGTGKSSEVVTCKKCFDTGSVLREWCSGMMSKVKCTDCKKEEEK